MVGVVVVIIGGFVRLGQGHVGSFETGDFYDSYFSFAIN